MNLEWQSVNSEMIDAEAYDPDTERIYLRFKDGKEYYYESCPLEIWEEFTADGQSRGKYFHSVLKFKNTGRYS